MRAGLRGYLTLVRGSGLAAAFALSLRISSAFSFAASGLNGATLVGRQRQKMHRHICGSLFLAVFRTYGTGAMRYSLRIPDT